MTKKDYEVVACALAHAIHEYEYVNASGGAAIKPSDLPVFFIETLSGYFAADNTRFNEDKFIDYTIKQIDFFNS